MGESESGAEPAGEPAEGPAGDPAADAHRVRTWSGGATTVSEPTRTLAWVSAHVDGGPERIPAAAVARHPHGMPASLERQPLVQLDDARGAALAADVTVPLPTDGRSLVLLVDLAADGRATVTAHAMHLDPPPPVGAPGWRDLATAVRARWLGGPPAPPLLPRVYPQLFADPVVADFLDLPPASADG